MNCVGPRTTAARRPSHPRNDSRQGGRASGVPRPFRPMTVATLLAMSRWSPAFTPLLFVVRGSDGGDADSRALNLSIATTMPALPTRTISGLWIFSAERFVFDLVDPCFKASSAL
jgi:hypothetical protein